VYKDDNMLAQPVELSASNEQSSSVCSNCFGTGWEMATEKGVRQCGCIKKGRLRGLIEAAHIPARFSECTLSNFHPAPGNASHLLAYSYAHQIIRDYPEVDQGLLLMGSSGVGKTHLGAALLLGLLERGVSCRFYDYATLLKDILRSYNSKSETTELDLLGPIFSVDVLLIDELGAMKPTEWVLDTVRLIINRRYNDRKLTIATTNYPDEAQSGGQETLEQRVGVRIRSRLHQMCKTAVLDGEDRRRWFDVKETKNIRTP
jgi:DNA replication protein DnaC